ncbi:helix-turn-helix domain-containing protein [Pedobacter sp. Leaf216]|uniref:helix-turn-helix domain-containing protein n=1 Tax=Pedobacter sp. Leaf216 TaxID=1735684 RepID=UPI00138EF9FD
MEIWRGRYSTIVAARGRPSAVLLQNKIKLLDRKSTLLKFWGEDNRFNARRMNVYITRLHKFLKSEPSIVRQSIREQGYKLAEI